MKPDDILHLNMVRCTNCKGGLVDEATGKAFGQKTPDMIQTEIDECLYMEDE